MKRRTLEPIIVETSLRLFQEKGYNNVSVVEICNECDITKPTFYKYALSKGDLLRFYFKRIPENFDVNWADISKYGSSINCIEQAMQTFLHNFTNYGLDLCTQLYIQNIESYTDTFLIPEDFNKNLIRVIAKAQAEGEILNPTDPEKLAQTLVSLMIGYVGYWVLFNGTKDVEQEFSRAMRSLLQPAPGKESE